LLPTSAAQILALGIQKLGLPTRRRFGFDVTQLDRRTTGNMSIIVYRFRITNKEDECKKWTSRVDYTILDYIGHDQATHARPHRFCVPRTCG
jgi:hypothetical protein